MTRGTTPSDEDRVYRIKAIYPRYDGVFVLWLIVVDPRGVPEEQRRAWVVTDKDYYVNEKLWVRWEG